MESFDRIDVLMESLLAEQGEPNWVTAKSLANLVLQLGKDLKVAVNKKNTEEIRYLAGRAKEYAGDLQKLAGPAPAPTPARPASAAPASLAPPPVAEKKVTVPLTPFSKR